MNNLWTSGLKLQNSCVQIMENPGFPHNQNISNSAYTQFMPDKLTAFINRFVTEITPTNKVLCTQSTGLIVTTYLNKQYIYKGAWK